MTSTYPGASSVDDVLRRIRATTPAPSPPEEPTSGFCKIKKYWKWILLAALIGVILFFYSRHKKKLREKLTGPRPPLLPAAAAVPHAAPTAVAHVPPATAAQPADPHFTPLPP
jgi:hypothetical protein